MARKLTMAQKLLLDKHPDVQFESDLPPDVLQRVVALNDYETVYQDIDRYLWDKSSSRRFNNARIL